MDARDARTEYPDSSEWLEADGRGGFASGTVSGIRTRRYHALLLTAVTPPTERVALVNGVEAWIDTPAGRLPLTAQRYMPDVVVPEGGSRATSFSPEPWPSWRYELPGGGTVEHEVFVPAGFPVTVLSWSAPAAKKGGARLWVRPLLSGRDMHALHEENAEFRFESAVDPDHGGARVYWRPYAGLPEILAWSNGEYVQDPQWYRNFLYTEERARGLDCVEDLAAPGVFGWDLSRGEAVLVLGAVDVESEALVRQGTALEAARRLRAAEKSRRRRFPTRLHRAADAYLVRRGEGRTVIAGYPWFADWGRDTAVSLRGLCLATGRFKEAREILFTWGDAISEGMVPNCFTNRGEPQYESADAALWYVVAVGEYLRATQAQKKKVSARDRERLAAAVEKVMDGYAGGTRHGIAVDSDGLVRTGETRLPLTWMDARIDGAGATPRTGKPVELQALWLNALLVAIDLTGKRTTRRRWQDLFDRALNSFQSRFWNEEAGYLNDVVDPEGRAGEFDATFRPNQVFAVGGLPVAVINSGRARRITDAVEARLVTPLGLRTLAPGEPGYTPLYQGGRRERDGAYHQGPAWPWLLGAFVEAWVRVRGGTPAVVREARACFLEPLLAQMDVSGLGHLPELADGEPPFTPRGCPFQAWSVGEALRLTETVLKVDGAETAPVRRAARPKAKHAKAASGS